MDDDSDSSDRSGNDTNTRTYDCVYCKRGFTTAQALGGHMNIHRRDRARVRESPKAQDQMRTFFPLASGSRGEKRSGKGELDSEKLQELMRYGKHLGLNIHQSDDDDSDDDKR